MKKILKISIILFSISLSAQYPVLSTTSLLNASDDGKIMKYGNYAKDTNNERDQYVGLWKYENGNTIFELKIEKINKMVNKFPTEEGIHYYFTDEVILKYKLTVNGIVLHDNLNQVLFVEGLESLGMKHRRFNFLDGNFLDYTRNVMGSFKITRLQTNPAKIIFNLGEFNYKLLNEPSFYQPGVRLFDVPTNGIEMIKVE